MKSAGSVGAWCLVSGLSLIGCGGAAIHDTAPPAMTNNVTVTGAISGTFSAQVSAVYNRQSAKERTEFSVVTAQEPGLGINVFALDASIVGMPEAIAYSEMDAQITATLTLNDGADLESTVNSQNRLDLTGLVDTMPQQDGSVVYDLHGVAAGSVASTETSDIVFFTVNF